MQTAPIGFRPGSIAAVVLAIGTSIGVAAPAAAQSACAPHDDLAERLESQFSERAVGLGLSGRQRLIELYRSEDGRTWSLVATTAEGVSCIIDAGVAWSERQQLPKGWGVSY